MAVYVMSSIILQPDIGAPVTLNKQLWGITSGWVSEDCSQDISPIVFNRVSLPVTRDWIESTIQDIEVMVYNFVYKSGYVVKLRQYFYFYILFHPQRIIFYFF